MAKEKNDQVAMHCPVARFFSEMEKICGRRSEFFDHLQKSQVEFLKAFRSLVDDRIGVLEKKQEKGKKRTTKIEVE
jgi:hypothetical protein